ncbi:MAG: antitoxin [Crenarchaeota archaeon]|nr:antitoxin [Thermoproteota archaeon]
MGGSVVIGVRVPRWVKEELERLGIDYAREVREYLLRRVREERARRLMREIDDLMRSIGRVRGNLSAESIREDRDGGWSG